MMASTDMARWSLRWANPTRPIPDGMPRVKKAMLVTRGTPCPPEILAEWVAGGLYAVCWELITQRPIKRWSREAKSRARRRNLRKRLENKVPLFADQLEAEELARRPEYFAAEDA